MSRETHLADALIGIGFAIVLRRLDVPPHKRYAWEGNIDGDEEGEAKSRSRPVPDKPDRF